MIQIFTKHEIEILKQVFLKPITNFFDNSLKKDLEATIKKGLRNMDKEIQDDKKELKNE